MAEGDRAVLDEDDPVLEAQTAEARRKRQSLTSTRAPLHVRLATHLGSQSSEREVSYRRTPV
eukprot:5073191-Amphidinium_carterae.1